MAKHYTGKEILSACEKTPGVTVKNGRGDHFKVYKDGEMMVVPYNIKGEGTFHKIMKWCKIMGIIFIFCLIVFPQPTLYFVRWWLQAIQYILQAL